MSRKPQTDDAVIAEVQNLYSKTLPLLICEIMLFTMISVFMFWNPFQVWNCIMFIVGGALIIFGLYRMGSGFVTSYYMGGGWLDVVLGGLGAGLGFLFLVYQDKSMIMLVYLFVLLFLFKAVKSLIFAVNMARAKFGNYGFDFFLSVIMVGLAVVLLFFPGIGAMTMMYYIAITLLLYVAVDIYLFIEMLRLKRLANQDITTMQVY